MTDFTVWIDAEEMSGQSLPPWASILIIGIALTGAVLVVVPWFTGGAKPDRSYTGTTPVLSGIICIIVAQCLFLMLSWLPSMDGVSQAPGFDATVERVYGIQGLGECDTFFGSRSCDEPLPDSRGWPSVSDRQTIDVRYIKDGHVVYGQIILDRPHVTVTDGKGNALKPQVTVREALKEQRN